LTLAEKTTPTSYICFKAAITNTYNTKNPGYKARVVHLGQGNLLRTVTSLCRRATIMLDTRFNDNNNNNNNFQTWTITTRDEILENFQIRQNLCLRCYNLAFGDE
jgi:hypothetical protein